MNDQGEGQASATVEQVGKSVAALKTVMEIAEKSPELREAGVNVAKVAKTLTTLVNNCLLPIAAVNFAFAKGREYFSNSFPLDMENITKNIPPDSLIEPKASIAAPILQGLTFAHEEESLRDMYLHLLSSSMDGRAASLAHPAFVEVIRQIDGAEAKLLKMIFEIEQIPIIQIRRVIAPSRDFNVISNHVINLHNQQTDEPIVNTAIPTMVDNWQRLGLVIVSYSEHLTDKKSYSWCELRPEYIDAKEKYMDQQIEFQKGLMTVTAFGAQFAKVVL